MGMVTAIILSRLAGILAPPTERPVHPGFVLASDDSAAPDVQDLRLLKKDAAVTNPVNDA
jgi:uncharacterized protein (DUF362 family)